MAKLAYAIVLAGFASAACTKEENRCKADADCTDPAYSFCDVDGQYAASGGAKGVCTIVPPDCPVDRCGCEPGATSCTSNELTTCNTDGKSEAMVDCTLGCEDSGMACKTFDPANGLGPALMQAARQDDVVLPSAVTINTDTGVILDSSSVSVTVTSLVVAQGSTSIRVFVAKSFEIQNARVTGSMPIAFVASGPVSFEGLFDASADLASAGPGALELPATSVGGGGVANGGGGAGNATSGGSGAPVITSIGPFSSPGGMAQTTFEPLLGGARGGDPDSTGPDGGGGGGGVEIVSMTSIEIDSNGTLHVGGGGGGADGSGGGSGGNIVLQAPSITVDGTIAANGGSGGAGSLPGNDATADDHAAASVMSAGQLFVVSSGSGGTGDVAPTNGQIMSGSGTTAAGGGAAGRVLIGTLDGTFARGSTAILSATVTAQMLVTM